MQVQFAVSESAGIHFRGEVEEWRRFLAHWRVGALGGRAVSDRDCQVFPNQAVSVNICQYLFRGEVEKWRSGEGMAETVQVFSPLDSLCQISSSAERTPKPISPSAHQPISTSPLLLPHIIARPKAETRCQTPHHAAIRAMPPRPLKKLNMRISPRPEF
jgi:hypothetical protein